MRYSVKIITVVCCIYWAIPAVCQYKLMVEVDGKVFPNPQKLNLRAGAYELIFRFPEDTAPSYRYEYYLENLDRQTHTSNYPVVRYTNLPGGTYVFRAKVKANNHVLSEHVCNIEIKQNFWEKWWFWVFILLFGVATIGLTIYFWVLYDFRQRFKTEQIRQRIAADLHDEVGANLSSIIFLTDFLQKKLPPHSPQLRQLLEKISSHSSESATLINDTIWALNPTYDSFEKLLERIKSFAAGLFSAKDIAFSLENHLENTHVELSVIQRRNLYLILKEALNNAAKHAEAQKVFLKIEQNPDGVLISVQDDGRGFDLGVVSEGNGLKNYQLRASPSEIEVSVRSELGQGTWVRVFLPKNH
jgi:hypothetical protein